MPSATSPPASRPADGRSDTMTDVDEIRSQLDHPVVDGDGHLLEYLPLIRDLIVEEADETVGQRFDDLVYASQRRREVPRERRRDARAVRSAWWSLPAANSLDRATAMLPELFANRLDEFGIDFAVLYPTHGLLPMLIGDDELRTAMARACNRYYAEAYGPYRDRLEPVAIIPMHTPEEAIAELDVAVGELGLKAVIMTGIVLRPLEGAEDVPGAHWIDTPAHASGYDYDPVWQRCVELGVAPTFHGTGYGWGSRASSESYMFNHIGAFASAQEAACRAVVMGGVAKRFPELQFSFLEGGVAWAATLCADTIGHYEKRNRESVLQFDPNRIDRDLIRDLVRQHGPASVVQRVDRLDYALFHFSDPDEERDTIDEWAESGIESEDDIVELFADRFSFGCEADDPMTGIAFDAKLPPVGRDLRPIFASDIGHWDVPDARGVLPEAWELVERGDLDLAQFRAFTFSNAVRLWGAQNPAFFDGTPVAAAARAELDTTPSRSTSSG